MTFQKNKTLQKCQFGTRKDNSVMLKFCFYA